jgi:drug/metabolite transporter (DMT)-like permease
MSWIVLTVIAQAIYAIVDLINKFIITSKRIEKPFVFAFFVSILSAASLLIFIPGSFGMMVGQFNVPSIYNVHWPDAAMVAMSLVTAFTFFYALVSLYSALRDSDASDVLPVVGSISAIVTFIFSLIVFREVLSQNFFIGFIFLVLGTLLISTMRLDRNSLMESINAGVMFAINAAMMKAMFAISSFDHAFFWSKVGLLVFLGSLLLVPRYAGKFSANVKRTKKSGSLWVIGNTAFAGIATFMVLKSIEMGNVSVIQALGGLKFAFVIIISILFGKFIPKAAGENNTLKDIVQKGVAVVIILFGFFYLFL